MCMKVNGVYFKKVVCALYIALVSVHPHFELNHCGEMSVVVAKDLLFPVEVMVKCIT